MWVFFVLCMWDWLFFLYMIYSVQLLTVVILVLPQMANAVSPVQPTTL